MFNLGCAYRCGKRLCGSHKICVSIMRPKPRTELRVIISQLYDYLKTHDDLLDYESAVVNMALQLLVVADCHLAYLGISHRLAKSLEK